MTRTVFCTFAFEARHCWPDAPAEVAFLRATHRHMFHVRAEAPVTHANRDIEFILLKRALVAVVQAQLATEDTGDWSCEHWAEYLLVQEPRLAAVEVSEDGENGARVTR